jgi:hypothetical protein
LAIQPRRLARQRALVPGWAVLSLARSSARLLVDGAPQHGVFQTEVGMSDKRGCGGADELVLEFLDAGTLSSTEHFC